MNEDVVVSAAWLADRLDEVAVVDVREAWEYESIGHVPGAVNVPFDEFRGGGEVGMLPPVERWEELLGGAGIEADGTVVAYDDTHGVFAARFLVTAELLGHAGDLRLLDGDYSAWSREQPTTREPTAVEPTRYELREPADSPLVDRATVEAAVGTDAALVDTRTSEEFAAGHLPGAVNLDWVALVDEETRGLRPRDELESILAGKGITRDRRVILYCNTARRISHTYVVLRYLGYRDVGFYEGSLTEWTGADGPLVTGSE